MVFITLRIIGAIITAAHFRCVNQQAKYNQFDYISIESIKHLIAFLLYLMILENISILLSLMYNKNIIFLIKFN